MAERYPVDGAVGNGFGRRHLHEDEACLLYKADYPVPLDMRVPGSCKLRAGGVSVCRYRRSSGTSRRTLPQPHAVDDVLRPQP